MFAKNKKKFLFRSSTFNYVYDLGKIKNNQKANVTSPPKLLRNDKCLFQVLPPC